MYEIIIYSSICLFLILIVLWLSIKNQLISGFISKGSSDSALSAKASTGKETSSNTSSDKFLSAWVLSIREFFNLLRGLFLKVVEATISWRYLNYLNGLLTVLNINVSAIRFYYIQMLFFIFCFISFGFYYISFIFSFFWLLFSFFVSFIVPVILLKSWLSKKKQGFLSSFSFFLDLLVLCLSSGRSFNQSLKICTQSGLNDFLLENLQQFIEKVEGGVPSEQAWQSFSFRCQERDVYTFVISVLQSQRQGISLIDVLQMQSRRIKSVLYNTAEKKALSLSTKLIFPIVFFIFPITFIIISFPLVYNLIIDLG